MIYSVYKVTFENKKSYVGITSRTLYERKLEHESIAKRKSGYFFHRALVKYKKVNWEIIYQSKCINDIKEKEIYFISKYNTTNSKFGYNLTKGGDGMVGYKMSKAQIEIARINGKKINNYKYLQTFYKNNPNSRSELMKKYWKENKEKANKYLLNLTGTGKPKKQIQLMHLQTNQIFKFESLSLAKKSLGLSMGSLSQLVNGLKKQVKGYSLC